jgi:serine/threonine-protein kinase
VRHPNVVTVEEAAIDPAGVYLVMPYVEGDSLSGLVRAELADGGTIPRRIVARILCDALAGLHAAHELRDDEGRNRNVVHRDFTPSNILIGIDGMSRLADFGIAKTASAIARTTSGQMKGKIGYMSPEQVRTLPLDRRADVWAAGVVAWECMAGRRLYEGDEVGVLLRIAQDVPPRLRSVCPDVPHPIDAAIAAALEPALELRCASADELRLRLLAAFEAGDGIADSAEVGRYVQRLAGRGLAARRDRAAAVVRSRRSDTAHPLPSLAPAPSSEAATPADPVTPSVSDTSADGDTTAVDFTRSAAAKRRPGVSRAFVVATALTAAGLTGIVVYSLRSPTAPAQGVPAEATKTSAPPPSAEPPTVTVADTTPESRTAASATASASAAQASLSAPVRPPTGTPRRAPAGNGAGSGTSAKGSTKGPKLGDYPSK